MTEPDRTNTSLARIRAAVLRALGEHESESDTLARVCQTSVELLPVDGASISLMIGRKNRETLYASDEVISRIEALQFSLGEGPCYEAFDTGRPILVPDLANDQATTWPVFAGEMITEPVGAIFAFPLARGAICIGALNLYRRLPGWLSPTELATALQVVDIAAMALLSVHLDESNAEKWLTLPGDRAQIHQATGMLVAAFGISAEHALARLRAYAFAGGHLVDDVARDLVTRKLTPADLQNP